MASDYLYHVTTAGAFDSIADDGLHVGSGSSRFGGGYGAHSKGRLFLTSPEGVFYWHSKIGQGGVIESAEEVPVVLRLLLEPEEEEALQDDKVGTRDAAGHPAYYLTDTSIDPEGIEVWDGSDWVEATDTEEGEIVGVAEDAGELIEEDDEEWTEFDEMCLFPSELRP